MDRRELLAAAAASAAATAFWADVAKAADSLAGIPIIDAHIHIFDNRRPQGAPYVGSKYWKGGVNSLAMYEPLARKAGIVGVMAMECSAWVEDNLWLVEQVGASPFGVGMVGDLSPDKPDFAELLDRFSKNQLYRGIRYGTYWGNNINNMTENAAFIAGLKHLADRGLTLDTGHVDLQMLKTVIRLTDQVPNLKVVLNHVPSDVIKPGEEAATEAAHKEIHGRPNIFAKMSWDVVFPENLQQAPGGAWVPKLSAYKDQFDMICGVFGEDRVMFESNYPQTYTPQLTTLVQLTDLAKVYYADKPRPVAEKFFWRNSARAYGWIKRAKDQPDPKSA